MKKLNNGPKVLLLDCETAPILANVWDIWNQNIALNQIESDWHILSWAAKWLGEKEILYADQRKAKRVEDDSEILKEIWQLLNEADVVITHNGEGFDFLKLNTRFILNGMKPPSSYKSIDTLKIAKKKFGFTSNKLEYLTKKLCKKNKKSDHKKFPGFELWRECIAGNSKAWNEMEKYNKKDITSLEELYNILIPWDSSINFNLYHDEAKHICKCGCDKLIKNGYAYTSLGKYQRYACSKCGAEVRSRDNIFGKEKRKSLKTKV